MNSASWVPRDKGLKGIGNALQANQLLTREKVSGTFFSFFMFMKLDCDFMKYHVSSFWDAEALLCPQGGDGHGDLAGEGR
jgi:hypothetical protein